jgi:hypothetical protein
VTSRLAALLFVFAAGALLAGCGVKGAPELAADKADGFPHTYPQGAAPSDGRIENILIDKWR